MGGISRRCRDHAEGGKYTGEIAKMARLVLIIIVALIANSASAAVSVGDLYAACSSQRVSEQEFCIGYIIGVVESLDQSPSILYSTFCLPRVEGDRITYGQVRDVVVGDLAMWVQRKMAPLPAVQVVTDTLHHNWPCRE
jgi:Rap1a immunity proteins